MRVFLIRHPPAAVAPDVCYGASDVDLADDVRECAARLREVLPARLPVFSSPLRRCRRLAEALHQAPRYDARLREMHFGTWELQPWNRIERLELDAWAASPLTYTPPGGESVQALQARVAAFLVERIGSGRQDFAAVTHAGVMRIVAAQLQGLDLATCLGLRFGHGELARFEVPAWFGCSPPGA